MAKVSGPYTSLVRGVSQQVPEQRLDGQHEEQVNVLGDPVRGLVRRQGTVLVKENPLPLTPGLIEHLATAFDERDIKVEEDNFTLLTRRPGTTGPGPSVYALRRGGDDGALLPVVVTPTASTRAAQGINGVAVVGRYLVLASSSPTAVTTAAVWDTTLQKGRANVFVRGGAYSKTYTVRIKITGVPEFVAVYTTPSSSYQGDLDTSDIPFDASDYVKRVNDRVNSYNAAVTQWIGTAAQAVQPSAIAASIHTALISAGLTAHATIVRNGAVLLIQAAAGGTIEYVTVDDSGDGTQLKALHRTVTDPSDLPPLTWPGFVVKVSPTGQDAYYLRATAETTDVGQVTWEESFGESAVLSNVFLVGTFHSGSLYIGASPADLTSALPAGHGLTVPEVNDRKVGDGDTSPTPHFAGRVVTHISVYQDRLIVVADNVVSTSAIGDYFNFWRSTVLSVLDDDPVEVFANGSEDDTIYHAVYFDRGLVLFGDRQQYAINGKVPLTPSTATVIQSSAHKDTTGVRPLALGDYMFYAKAEDKFSRLYQISVGQVDDTSNSVEVSQQLDTYIRGRVRALVGLSMPDAVVVRTSDVDNGCYVFRYVDSMSGERLLDAWSRWEFAPECGKLVALSAWQDKLRLVFARDIAGVPHLVVDEASLVPGVYQYPYLDSMTRHGERSSVYAGMQCAWGANPVATRAWQGQEDGNIAALFAELGEDADCRIGYPFPAWVTLTSPTVRDNKDAPVTVGRTTVNALTLSHANTGAYNVRVASAYGDTTPLAFRGLTVNGINSFVGTPKLHRGTARAVVGREVRDYTATIESFRWHPFSITSVDWVGQIFNNTRRV